MAQQMAQQMEQQMEQQTIVATRSPIDAIRMTAIVQQTIGIPKSPKSPIDAINLTAKSVRKNGKKRKNPKNGSMRTRIAQKDIKKRNMHATVHVLKYRQMKTAHLNHPMEKSLL